MTDRSVLVVEDNQITRRMFRVALETRGIAVTEVGGVRAAADALSSRLPGLVLIDLTLPDGDGIRVLEALRALPGGRDIPAIAMSGFLSKLEDAKTRGYGFVELLFKPVDPRRLLELVTLHLDRTPARGTPSGGRILLADDDPVHARLLRLQLEHAGFDVETAKDGQEALEKARERRPDAIVSDVLMPAIDGFRLSRAVAEDPRVSVPVVLVSAAFTEEEDRRLAESVGAYALVERTPDHAKVIAAVRAGLLAGPRRPASYSEPPTDSYVHRIVRQLERQVGKNADLEGRIALHEAALGVIARLGAVSRGISSVRDFLPDLLLHTLDAAGVSMGAIYLLEGGTFVLGAHHGFAADEASLGTFFGRADLLAAATLQREPLAVPGVETVTEPWETELLAAARAQAIAATPLLFGEESLGALVLAAAQKRLPAEWLAFSQAVAVQIAHAVALSRTVAKLALSEESSRRQARLATFAAETSTALAAPGTLRSVLGRCAEIAVASLDAAFVRIWTLDEAKRELVLQASAGLYTRLDGKHARLPLDGEKKISLIARKRRPYLSNDFSKETFIDREWASREGLVAFAGYPLVVEEELKGVVAFFARAPIGDFAFEALGSVAGNIAGGIERKRAEQAREELEAQLRRAQKMEAIGRLAGGVAHDFNNVLTAILGYADLIMARLEDGEPIRKDAEEIKKAGERAASLTRQLLVLSRRELVTARVLDVNAIVADMERMLLRLLGEDIELVVSLDSRVGRVKADQGHVEQVILNLCVNARDAMPRGGKLTIETANVDVAGGETGARGRVAPGSYVLLAVTDTGCGMTPETLLHIFEPFFTTKEEGKGTGLGLSTVYGIVDGAGGHVAVATEPGKGSSFKVFFPRVDEALAAIEAPSLPLFQGGTETILLVEDDEPVRNLARAVLGASGYRVIVAANGAEALATCERGDRVDLVVSDVIMPGMSGPDLAERLRRAKPSLKVLFVSGYTSGQLHGADALGAGTAFLQKPFSPPSLTRKVRELLDGR